MKESAAGQTQQQDCEKIPLMHVRAPGSRSEVASTFDDTPSELPAAPEVLSAQVLQRRSLGYFEPAADSPPDLPVQNASLLI
jgi:hypothetical protein